MIASPERSGKVIIDRVDRTSDTLSGRGGLALFSRYVRGIGLLPRLDDLFGSIRKSAKGLPVGDLFHQLFCWFLDGKPHIPQMRRTVSWQFPTWSASSAIRRTRDVEQAEDL
jgi:hypothetical protein